MKRLFEQSEVTAYRKLQRKYIIVWITSCTVALALLIVAVVLWKQLGRVAAQTIATICTAVIGCVSVYLPQVMALNRKKIDFVQKMLLKECKTVHLNNLSVAKETTTYDGLQFYEVLASEDDGEHMYYLFPQKHLEENTTKLYIVEKYICGSEAENNE